MQKSFENVEEVLEDELFNAWFLKTSNEQVAAWEQLMQANPQNSELVEEAIVLMQQLYIREDGVVRADTDKAYTKLTERLNETGKNTTSVFQLKPRRNRWWMAAAAVFVFAAVITYIKLAAHKESIKSQYGQISTHQLPDGSDVILNANSVVTLGDDWKEGKDREVWLKGEAFFHVMKNPVKNRFIVHTDQLDVIVTGTRFNVITRENKTSVLLTEGSVIIKTKDGKEIIMKPGDFVEMLDSKVEKKTANQEVVLAWKENKLIFENTSMKEAVSMISEHYGVKITLTDQSIADDTLNGILPNDNLDNLLKALEAAKNYKITRNDNEIIISKP